MRTNYALQAATTAALTKLPSNSVSQAGAQLGVQHGEPVLVIADALLRYANAYAGHWGEPAANDANLRRHLLAMLKATKALLDYEGAVALELNVTTDSKDNGALWDILETAKTAAGITEEL